MRLPQQQNQWTSTLLWDGTPHNTSVECINALHELVKDPVMLSIATESSSSPSGIISLESQAYVYTGPNLGNYDECPYQFCLAGTSLIFAGLCVPFECTALDIHADPTYLETLYNITHFSTFNNSYYIKDNITMDLDDIRFISEQYYEIQKHAGELNWYLNSGWTCGNYQFDILYGFSAYVFIWCFVAVSSIISTCRYIMIVKRNCKSLRMRRDSKRYNGEKKNYNGEKELLLTTSLQHKEAENDKGKGDNGPLLVHAENDEGRSYAPFNYAATDPTTHKISSASRVEADKKKLEGEYYITAVKDEKRTDDGANSSSSKNIFWSSFNLVANYKKLLLVRKDTACLDGLRVGSILMVIFGHVLVITTGIGAGITNPADLYPDPNTYSDCDRTDSSIASSSCENTTTTLVNTYYGQIAFAARYAVDTFLILSGYLVVRVMYHKLVQRCVSTNVSSKNKNPSWSWFIIKYIRTIPGLMLHRILRILPLYVMTMTFYTHIAPHLGDGPFWYQWNILLLPCLKYEWMNLLFINNFIPEELRPTGTGGGEGGGETCFYHSWYLAVDIQLFALAPLFVYLFYQNKFWGRIATGLVCASSVGITVYLSFVRGWSSNSFDGAAAARFNVEGYTKPHVRAQSYFAGMLVAMCLPLMEDAAETQTRNAAKSKKQEETSKHDDDDDTNTKNCQSYLGLSWLWRYRQELLVTISLILLGYVTFCTANGAYSRRPCSYSEFPEKDECGSTWSLAQTALYTSLGRTGWILSVCVIMSLCLLNSSSFGSTSSLLIEAINYILSFPMLTLLSQLTFGAYLIHPIVIFVWHLSGATQKLRLTLLDLIFQYIAVTVVSYFLALVFTLFIEMPCASYQKYYLSPKKASISKSKYPDQEGGTSTSSYTGNGDTMEGEISTKQISTGDGKDNAISSNNGESFIPLMTSVSSTHSLYNDTLSQSYDSCNDDGQTQKYQKQYENDIEMMEES